MIASYLYVNALLYLVFTVLITLNPSGTSHALGYEQLSASGRSEYLVVYGGLQLGFAAFFAWVASIAPLHRTGIVFALCLYAPIVIYRVVTVARFWPVRSMTVIVGALELLLLLGAALLFLRVRP